MACISNRVKSYILPFNITDIKAGYVKESRTFLEQRLIPYVIPSVRPPLADPQTLLTGSQTLLTTPSECAGWPSDPEGQVEGSESLLKGSEDLLGGLESLLKGLKISLQTLRASWGGLGTKKQSLRDGVRTEFLPILQDLVFYQGRCPKSDSHHSTKLIL